MKPANGPLGQWTVTLVATQRGSVVARLGSLMRDGKVHTYETREWAAGRPTPGELADLLAAVEEDLSTFLVGTLGVQGVLLA